MNPMFAKVMEKIKTALESMKGRMGKDKLPSLEALKVYLNKMKPKDPNAPSKINYYGGVFKLARLNPPYRVHGNKALDRMKQSWEQGVLAVRRPAK